jgi:hypothetical protein
MSIASSLLITMSLTALLEIAISLILLYLLFSQITLSIVELYAGIANTRGKFLYERLCEALGETSTEKIYKSAPVNALYREGAEQNSGKKNDSPTYISPAVFAQAVVSLAAPNPIPAGATSILTDPGTPTSLQAFVYTDDLPSTDSLGNLLKAQLQDAALTGTKDAEAQKLTQNLIDWYNDFQQRLTGRYKRRLRLPLLGVGFLVAFVFNVDTLRIVAYLRTHTADRQQAVALATRFVQAHPDGVTEGIFSPDFGRGKPDSTAIRQRAIAGYADTIAAYLQGNGLPIGWWTKSPPVTDSTNTAALVNSFYVPKPGGVAEQLPSQIQQSFLAIDTVASGKLLRKAGKILFPDLTDKQQKSLKSSPFENQVRNTMKTIVQAQLAMKPSPDYTKAVKAQGAIQEMLNLLEYGALHKKPISAADSLIVANSITDCERLLAITKTVRPVRWAYAPYYLRYQRPKDAAQSMQLGGEGSTAHMTYQPWKRVPTNPHDPEFKSYPVLDGQPELTWRAAGSWWCLIGWSLTALAMMVGAPFWFDLLNRLVNIRNVGIKPSRAS